LEGFGLPHGLLDDSHIWATQFMISIIRVEQSKFATIPIDEDSHECIHNYIQILSELEPPPAVHEVFLKDTKAVCTKILGTQEVNFFESFVSMVVADTLQLCKSGGTEGCRKHKGCDCAG